MGLIKKYKVMSKTSRVELTDLEGKTTNKVVYIGRSWGVSGKRSKWSNPKKITDYGNPSQRRDVINFYRRYLFNNKKLMASILELKDMKLLCHCNKDEACHGDVLINAVNHTLSALKKEVK